MTDVALAVGSGLPLVVAAWQASVGTCVVVASKVQAGQPFALESPTGGHRL